MGRAMQRFLMTAAVLFLVPVGVLCAEGDWSEFRGPLGNGHANVQQAPVRWSQKENVFWKQPLPGEGWSSPVLSEGKIYLTAAVPREGDEENRYDLKLLVLSERTGAIEQQVAIFEQSPEAPKIHNKNSHASPTPLIEGDLVYVHFGHQGTACVTRSGRIVWKNDTLAYKPVHGNGGSPIIAGKSLVFSCDGASEPFVVALDKHTGEELWRTTRQVEAPKKFSFSTPQLIVVGGKPQVISPGSNCVVAYNPQNGEEIWTVKYDGYSVIPRPVFLNGLLYVCTGYDSPSMICIEPTGRGDVTETHVKWVIRKGVPHTPSLLALETEIYMVSDRGVASCIDAASGETHWQQRLGGKYSASPILAAGNI
ncbi:MAG TPA: serine/threonine protein kinase, partial [Planctomycetaceae bacterium]|nr:serine/threonine protein kinase [Planctomycetaceae bacterium]